MASWKCPKCDNEEYEKDQFQATGGNFAKVWSIPTAGNCNATGRPNHPKFLRTARIMARLGDRHHPFA